MLRQVLVAMALLCSLSAASLAAQSSGPPLVQEDLCPFEGRCELRPFPLFLELPVYASRGSWDSEETRLPAGQCVRPVRSDVVTDQPGLVVLSRPWDGFAAGDTLRVLSYIGEGYFLVWSAGRIGEVDGGWSMEPGTSEVGETIQTLESSWWIEIAEPVAGWLGVRNAIKGMGASYPGLTTWGDAC